MFHVYNGNKNVPSCPYLKAQFPLVSHQREAYIQYQKAFKVACMHSLKTPADLCVCMYVCINVFVFVCMIHIMINGKTAFIKTLYGSSKVHITNFGSNFVHLCKKIIFILALYLETYLLLTFRVSVFCSPDNFLPFVK